MILVVTFELDGVEREIEIMAASEHDAEEILERMIEERVFEQSELRLVA